MRHVGRWVVLGGLLAITGCGSSASYPKLALQRSLYPGIGGLDAKQIDSAFDTALTLKPPLSGGVVWLDESRGNRFGPPLSEYSRAGVLEAVVAALNHPPFNLVSTLPTTVEFETDADGAPSLAAIRAAAATFQYDVAFILQTGVAQESGYNPFAIGYLGLVTAPLFPGSDVNAAAGAELCAVDVRSGIMLGCGVGKSRGEARWLFPLTTGSRAEALRDQVLSESVDRAAEQILTQIDARARGGGAAATSAPTGAGQPATPITALTSRNSSKP
jgi:hypothetical protein